MVEYKVGFGSGGKGRLEVFDDVNNNYLRIGRIKINQDNYNSKNGESWPAIGDVK